MARTASRNGLALASPEPQTRPTIFHPGLPLNMHNIAKVTAVIKYLAHEHLALSTDLEHKHPTDASAPGPASATDNSPATDGTLIDDAAAKHPPDTKTVGMDKASPGGLDLTVQNHTCEERGTGCLMNENCFEDVFGKVLGKGMLWLGFPTRSVTESSGEGFVR